MTRLVQYRMCNHSLQFVRMPDGSICPLALWPHYVNKCQNLRPRTNCHVEECAHTAQSKATRVGSVAVKQR